MGPDATGSASVGHVLFGINQACLVVLRPLSAGLGELKISYRKISVLFRPRQDYFPIISFSTYVKLTAIEHL